MFGLQFIAVNFLYLLFSLIVGIVVCVILSKKEKFTRPKRFGICIGTFLVVWMLPFWDLLLQKGIKTYYETFMMESQIYAYPEKDKDGKIESLGLHGFGEVNIDYLNDDQAMKRLSSIFSPYIKDFIEIRVYDDKNSEYLKIENSIKHDKYLTFENSKFHDVRISMNTKNNNYKFIHNKKNSARFVVNVVEESSIFELYVKKTFTFSDSRYQKVLATGWALEFPTNDENFRNKYLLFRGPSGNALRIQGIENYTYVFEELYGFFTGYINSFAKRDNK